MSDHDELYDDLHEEAWVQAQTYKDYTGLGASPPISGKKLSTLARAYLDLHEKHKKLKRDLADTESELTWAEEHLDELKLLQSYKEDQTDA